MVFSDMMNYILFTNPISSGTFFLLRGSARMAGDYLGLQPKQEAQMLPVVPLWKLASRAGPYVKLAGLSGATAVIFGAYAAHNLNPDKYREDARIFDVANRYHFFHTLAILGLPLSRRPYLGAILFVSGIIMFCCNCYYTALTQNKTFSRLAPIGATCLILGWLSFVF